MAPTVVLHNLTTTTTAMYTISNNNLSVYITNSSVVNSASFFGAFQDTAVGSSNLTIRTIVPPNIGTEPYRKTMINILLLRLIFSLSSSSSVSISNLTAATAAYFTLPIGSVEREVEHIVDWIHHASFHVDNLQGIEFLNFSNEPTIVSDLTNSAADIVYFTYRSMVTASDVNDRFPSTIFSFDFLLRLPQSVASTATTPIIACKYSKTTLCTQTCIFSLSYVASFS